MSDGPVKNADFVKPVTVSLQSNISERGEVEISGVSNFEKRIVATFENNFQRGGLKRVQITITSKAGAAPTELAIEFFDTDKHEALITITGTTDGNYIATINGTDHTFAASGNTIEEIRDGLQAVIDAGSEPVTTVASDTDKITITPDPAVTDAAYSITLTAPGTPDATLKELIGASEAQNTFYFNDENILDSAKDPELVINDQINEPIPFYLKGTAGKIQIGITLLGAVGGTDYKVNVQLFTNAEG